MTCTSGLLYLPTGQSDLYPQKDITSPSFIFSDIISIMTEKEKPQLNQPEPVTETETQETSEERLSTMETDVLDTNRRLEEIFNKLPPLSETDSEPVGYTPASPYFKYELPTIDQLPQDETNIGLTEPQQTSVTPEPKSK